MFDLINTNESKIHHWWDGSKGLLLLGGLLLDCLCCYADDWAIHNNSNTFRVACEFAIDTISTLPLFHYEVFALLKAANWSVCSSPEAADSDANCWEMHREALLLDKTVIHEITHGQQKLHLYANNVQQPIHFERNVYLNFCILSTWR